MKDNRLAIAAVLVLGIAVFVVDGVTAAPCLVVTDEAARRRSMVLAWACAAVKLQFDAGRRQFVMHIADALIQSGEIAQRHSELEARAAGGPAEVVNALTFEPINVASGRAAREGQTSSCIQRSIPLWLLPKIVECLHGLFSPEHSLRPRRDGTACARNI